MYEKPRVNVKVERGSTFTFTRELSYIVSILFTHVKPVKVYVRTYVKIRDSGNPPLGRQRRETLGTRLGSRFKGMPRKDLINIRNNDVRHLIPKVCSAVLKNGAEILIESIVKCIILSKLFSCKDLKSSAGRFRRFICTYVFVL